MSGCEFSHSFSRRVKTCRPVNWRHRPWQATGGKELMADDQLALGMDAEHTDTPPKRPASQRTVQRGTEYEMTVGDGTTLNVAVTALIKNLRRGRELEALYWAEQIERSYW